MARYKVGDRVLVKNPIPDGVPFGVNSEMREYEGKIVTIRYVNERRGFTTEYRIAELGYVWSEQMFECAERELDPNIISNHLLYGSVVTLGNGKEYLYTEKSLRSPNGHIIGINNYVVNGDVKAHHSTNENYEIKEVYSPSDNNYMFDKGVLVWKDGVAV